MKRRIDESLQAWLVAIVAFLDGIQGEPHFVRLRRVKTQRSKTAYIALEV